MDGVINVYKEAGWTSSDAVNKLKGILHQRHIGHGGTLDPDAEGVLPVCVGKATRLFDYISASHKTYAARIKFGITTDTQDASGIVLEEKEANVTPDALDKVLAEFVGEIDQIPPMYSALHVGGKRLYEIARSGETVELDARKVHIYDIKRISDIANNECTIRVVCGKGTYIRTLCHDIGQRLSCGAHMAYLLRESAAGLEVKNALKISEIQKRADENDFSFITPTDKAIEFMPAVELNKSVLKKIQNGNPVSEKLADKLVDGLVRIYCDGIFFGIAERINGEYRIKCMLGGGT